MHHSKRLFGLGLIRLEARNRKKRDLSRREFIQTSMGAALGVASASARGVAPWSPLTAEAAGKVPTPGSGAEGHVVGRVRIRNGDVEGAGEEAIDLLGAAGAATALPWPLLERL